MTRWEYLFVDCEFEAGRGQYLPRFCNSEEIGRWQAGPTMIQKAQELGGEGWEMIGVSRPHSHAHEWVMVAFKRPLEDSPAG